MMLSQSNLCSECFGKNTKGRKKVVGEIRGYIFRHCDECGYGSIQIPDDWQDRDEDDLVRAAQEMGWCTADETDAT